ncbi:hypothetical protein [Brevundimonas sp.]|uniref:hypothetical protein n=1 Tax=Brevundimonas sp. TaxID=1871086 RepID=UPI00289F45BF|nr:hypothetical protein [Brevundimonas sp.]
MAETGKKPDDISTMPIAGWGWCILGLVGLVYGVTFDATVESSTSYLDDRIFNLGQLATKFMILGAGSLSLLGGIAVLLAYGVRKDIRAFAGRDPSPQDAE